MEEVRRLATGLRRAARSAGTIISIIAFPIIATTPSAREERVLFHYNGHGVPKPTANGEIWVFNRSYTQVGGITTTTMTMSTNITTTMTMTTMTMTSTMTSTITTTTTTTTPPQYIPLSIYDLQSWMGGPSIYVYDCNNAGIIVESFKSVSHSSFPPSRMIGSS